MNTYPGSLRVLAEGEANLFKALAHPARVGILEILLDNERASIAELSAGTGVKASHLAQHLALLRHHRLTVTTRCEGQLFYQLAYPDVAGVLTAAQILLRALEGAGGAEYPARLALDLEAVLRSRSLIDDAAQ